MIAVQTTTNYKYGQYDLTVRDIDCDVLVKIEPICADMDRKADQKISEMLANDQLVQAIDKCRNKEALTTAEIKLISEFGRGKDGDFSIKDCQALWASFKDNIISVIDADGADVTADLVNIIAAKPKFLKMMSLVIFNQYKSAIEIDDVKKN